MADLPIDKERAREIFQAIKNSYMEALMAKDALKEKQQRLREEIAMKNGFYKKDGTTPDVSKVKAGPLKAAIDVFNGEHDKLAEQHEQKEAYLAEIRSGEIPKSSIDSLVATEISAKEAASAPKDAIAELKSIEDPDVITAIAQLAKEAAEQEHSEDNGKTPKKEKDFTLIQQVKELIQS